MKALSCLFFLFLVKTSLLGSNVKITPSDTLYMTIYLQEKDPVTLASINSQIESIDDCKILMFCNTLNVYILMFENASGKDIKDLFSVVEKKINYSVKLYLKEDSFKDILRDCLTYESKISPDIKLLLSK